METDYMAYLKKQISHSQDQDDRFHWNVGSSAGWGFKHRKG